ncbi:YtzI protein [Bacillus luteolus]|uniref:YtzI protein n=1 Tax=Litchfieldia luteola TaxID=682179 RepID=A0ABR9QIR5_9BACI|nr:YtzI protein [Cytobacillus luteolus]MBE4908393.1 YtzI protein [Cytobacillus luteolus]MBP1943181.1 preprotein translocase subunit SecG [Cytobacillus luteolus]
MYTVLIISIIIVFIVLILALITTSKAYGFKHTIDEPDQQSITKKEKDNQKEE